MSDHTYPQPEPLSSTDLETISEHCATLSRLVLQDNDAGLLQATAAVIGDVSRLFGERRRLTVKLTETARELAHSRQAAANLLAAIRASVHAAEDGETDPLWYVRDEYAHETGECVGWCH